MPIVTDYIRRIFGGPSRKEVYLGNGAHAETVIAQPPAELLQDGKLLVDIGGASLTLDGPIDINLPEKLITDGGINGVAPRIRVDNGQTGFFARRMWSLNYEFASTNPIAATPLVFRFILPTNFIIHAHGLTVDQGGVTLRTYTAGQGTPGGTFGTTHALSSENSMSEVAPYAFQSQVASGGTFTPTAGQVPLTPLRVRTAGATAQQSSVGGEAVSEKGRSPGTYYAVLQRMTGVTGDCTGVYSIVIEERP